MNPQELRALVEIRAEYVEIDTWVEKAEVALRDAADRIDAVQAFRERLAEMTSASPYLAAALVQLDAALTTPTIQEASK